jgi:tetratricopeptide (TPR) repeat protein
MKNLPYPSLCRSSALASIAALSLWACKSSAPSEASAPKLPSAEPGPGSVQTRSARPAQQGSASEAITPDPEQFFELVASERPKLRDSLALEHQSSEPVNHLKRARELNQLGELEGALTEARRALSHDPRDAEALELIAKWAERLGQKGMAADALHRFAALYPEDAMPLVREARLLLSLGELESAAKVGRQAIERDPDNPGGYQITGRAFLAQGQLGAAIHSFKQVLEIEPDHGYALNNLGYAYLLSGQNEEALEVLMDAAELLPDLAYVQNNLGVALERLGRLNEARTAFAKAADRSPRYLKAHLNLQRLEKLASGELTEDGELDSESYAAEEGYPWDKLGYDAERDREKPSAQLRQ